MKDSKVYYMKNKVEHWQVVSIGLVVYDTIAVTLAFFWHYGFGLIVVIR